MDNNIKTTAFTLVLNGLPFLQKQIEIIPQVFDHWYIVEGVALPVNCTSWCNLPDKKWYNSNFCSSDGTYELLNSLNLPNVTIIRKNKPWQGKLEMCNSFMHNVSNSILMEFDVDEIWQKEKLLDLLSVCRKKFNKFDSMKFKCNYYVGKDIKIKTTNSYGDKPYEWIRLWTVQESTHFLSHEPPVLNKKQNRIVEKNQTSEKNWIFDHYAYTHPSQVKFKEEYYGYKDAFVKWQNLQINSKFPVLASQFLPWIDDDVYLTKD